MPPAAARVKVTVHSSGHDRKETSCFAPPLQAHAVQPTLTVDRAVLAAASWTTQGGRAGDSLGGYLYGIPAIGLLRLRDKVRSSSRSCCWAQDSLQCFGKSARALLPGCRETRTRLRVDPVVRQSWLVLFMSSGFDEVTAHP